MTRGPAPADAASSRGPAPGGAAPFSLHHHLPHLLRRAHFDSEGHFSAIYGQDVTSRQLAVLTAVDRNPGGSQSAIAGDVGLDLNTCGDIVVRSIAKGLLRRERSAKDGRVFCLRLTEPGQAIVSVGQARADAYAKAASARLDADERAQLVGLLRKLLGVV